MQTLSSKRLRLNWSHADNIFQTVDNIAQTVNFKLKQALKFKLNRYLNLKVNDSNVISIFYRRIL